MDKSKFNERAARTLLSKGYLIAGKVDSPRSKYIPLYPNHRFIFSHPDKLKIIAEELAKAIKPLKVDLIASREAAGVPFGVATSLQAKKGFLYLRKEPKGYGLSSLILGDYKPGQRVVIIDDAVSRTIDKKSAVELLEASGLKVIGVAVVFDAYYLSFFSEQEWLRKDEKYQLISLIRWPELLRFAGQIKFISKELSDLIIESSRDPFGWQENEANWKKLKELAAKEKNLIFHESFKDI